LAPPRSRSCSFFFLGGREQFVKIAQDRSRARRQVLANFSLEWQPCYFDTLHHVRLSWQAVRTQFGFPSSRRSPHRPAPLRTPIARDSGGGRCVFSRLLPSERHQSDAFALQFMPPSGHSRLFLIAVAGPFRSGRGRLFAPHDHVDILGKALISNMDRRQTAHNCQGDAFLAPSASSVARALAKFRFLLSWPFTAATTLSSSRIALERQ